MNIYNIVLTITGDDLVLESFKDRIVDQDNTFSFTLEKFLPIPITTSIQETIEWKLQNWGCLNDIIVSNLQIYQDQIDIVFNSDKPVCRFCQIVSTQFQDLSIEMIFSDFADNEQGYYLYTNGQEQQIHHYLQQNQNQQIQQPIIYSQSYFQQPDLSSFIQCSICLIDKNTLLSQKQELSALICHTNHIFCVNCIKLYFQQLDSPNKICPICKTHISLV